MYMLSFSVFVYAYVRSTKTSYFVKVCAHTSVSITFSGKNVVNIVMVVIKIQMLVTL